MSDAPAALMDGFDPCPGCDSPVRCLIAGCVNPPDAKQLADAATARITAAVASARGEGIPDTDGTAAELQEAAPGTDDSGTRRHYTDADRRAIIAILRGFPPYSGQGLALAKHIFDHLGNTGWTMVPPAHDTGPKLP